MRRRTIANRAGMGERQHLKEHAVWQRMPTVGLAQTETIRLLNRMDTKYALPSHLLPLLLERAADAGYGVLVAGESPVSRYDTLYYDTADCAMYRLHHNGILRRQKIRVRTYTDTHTTFLEIKNKTNTGRTKKIRTRITSDACVFVATNAEAAEFLAAHARFRPEELLPQVNTRFDRITLVDAALTERVTVDFNLRFLNRTTGCDTELGGLAVLELKQDSSACSAMKTLLRDLRIHPLKLSKYCIGTVLTNHTVRGNRFREKLRAIEKLTDNRLIQ